MTSKEFTIWMQGFAAACNDYSPTPKQWDTLKDKLAEVEDKTLILESPSFPTFTPNTALIHPSPFIQPNDPYNPYRIIGTPIYQNPYTTVVGDTSGSSGTYTIPSNQNISVGTTITPPGVGSINIASGVGGSSTTYVNPQSGSWHYTYYTSTLQGVTGSNGPDDSKLNEVQLDKENQLELEFESK